MKNAVKKLGLYLLASVMLMANLQTVSAMQIPPNEREYTPSVLVGEITENDTQIPVYVYDWTTLYVKNGEDIIYRKFYKEEGKKNIKIKKTARQQQIRILSDFKGLRQERKNSDEKSDKAACCCQGRTSKNDCQTPSAEDGYEPVANGQGQR